MKSFAPRLTAAFLFAFFSLVAVHGQARDSRIISARAGGVNFVSGAVDVLRDGDWRRLAATDELRSGDVVKTGADGLVEVLLNPGSYLRLAGDSEFELTDASLDDLRLKLTRGSLVIEATGYGDQEAFIKIQTPHTGVSIIKSGVYRINALANKVSEVVVYDGRALVVGAGDVDATLLRGGRKARIGGVGGGATEVAKFDKKLERDALDLWSMERARSIAEVSRKISRGNINALLASRQFDKFWYSAEFAVPVRGAWFYSASRGCYTFLPFSAGWSSPYGFNHSALLAWIGSTGMCYECYDRRNNGYQPNFGNATRNNTQPNPIERTRSEPREPTQGGFPRNGPASRKIDPRAPADQ
ncbi:MAG TPA: FecR domain-containing protein [Pyrinomonadaceae bacterium]